MLNYLLTLAMLGSTTIVVAHHIDYDPTTRYNDLLDRVLRHRDAIISHLNWICFSDTAIQLQPIFAQWIQNIHAGAPGVTAPGATTSTSLTWGGGELVAIGGKEAADFLVHHIHAFTIHVTVLILLKGQILAFASLATGPGRGGTCQVSAWDHVFLGLFWMYNSISVVIFHFSWKMQSDVWGTISDQGIVTHITGGNFAQSSITINGWLRDFLWAQASHVISVLCLMFLFSGRGYWQELIESIVWAHNKLKTHYLLGGIATTWAFFLARIIAVG
ncbi:hypothetical protein ACJX0J_001772 [Zea mays]